MIYMVTVNESFFKECSGEIKHLVFKSKEQAEKTFQAYCELACKNLNVECPSSVRDMEEMEDVELGHNTYAKYLNGTECEWFSVGTAGKFNDCFNVYLSKYEIDSDKVYVVTDDCSFVENVEDLYFYVFSDKVKASAKHSEIVTESIRDFGAINDSITAEDIYNSSDEIFFHENETEMMATITKYRECDVNFVGTDFDEMIAFEEIKVQ